MPETTDPFIVRLETKTSKGQGDQNSWAYIPSRFSPAEGRVRVTVAGRIVAESDAGTSAGGEGISACLLLAAQRCGRVVARSDQALQLLSYKGDCTYYSIPIGGSKSEYAVWTYEKTL